MATNGLILTRDLVPVLALLVEHLSRKAQAVNLEDQMGRGGARPTVED